MWQALSCEWREEGLDGLRGEKGKSQQHQAFICSWLPGQHDADAPDLIVFSHHRGPKLLSNHVLLPEVFLLDILS